MSTPPERHHLQVRLEDRHGEAEVVLRIVCDSPEGAMCRLSCEAGCEEYSEGHEHVLSDQGQCNAELFINEGDVEVNYDPTRGGSFPLHDGAEVVVTWNGDYYAWRLASDMPGKGVWSETPGGQSGTAEPEGGGRSEVVGPSGVGADGRAGEPAPARSDLHRSVCVVHVQDSYSCTCRGVA